MGSWNWERERQEAEMDAVANVSSPQRAAQRICCAILVGDGKEIRAQ
jgi:hypothetical protein